MTERDGAVATVEIHGIGSGGEGVGRLADGRAVFVHRTAPGERVRVRITDEKKSWARARLLEVVEASEHRVEAPCPHYGRCGGCTLEHLAYDRQLHWKGRRIADALERIGGIDVEAPAVAPSPDQFRYRSRVSFTLLRLRGERVVAGFHELDAPGRIVDLDGSCLLPEEGISRVWDGLRAAWGRGARRLPAGRELRLTLRSLEEGILLVVEGGNGPGDPEALLNRVEGLVAVHVLEDGRQARVSGIQEGTERVLDRTVRVRGTAFLQVNRPAAALLLERIDDVVGGEGPLDGVRIVDGYCGLGILGRRWASRGAEVVGIELDEASAELACRDAPPGQDVRQGAVEDLLAGLLPADRVLLNPPRSGLHPDVPAILLERPVPKLVYVSCDPSTLARDAERMAGGYELASLEAFDLFPQTAHVETLAVFRGREAV